MSKMELKLSRNPLQKNPSCAYCGKTFSEKGMNLQLLVEEKVIHFPICQSCSEWVPSFEATVNLEEGYARVKR